MKTITEFSVTTLKNALKTKQELTTAGKTPEELPAAMGEALKLEGDKLTILLSALEAVEKKTNDLKRVVVLTLAEGESAPRGAEQKGEHYFSIEFFPPMPGQERKGKGRDGDRGGRGGRDGKGRGDKRGGKRGGGRDGQGRDAGGRRPPRGPRREGTGPTPQQAGPVRTTPIKPLTPITPKAAPVTPPTQETPGEPPKT